MYLVVIAWLYVAVLMAAAEATHSNGSILGAIFTFFLYGLMPVGLLWYFKQRKGQRQARSGGGTVLSPDEGSHASGTAQADGVTSVRKEP